MQGLEINIQLPDLWQQQAVRLLSEGGDVVVDAPTGAGKTWVFELFVKGRKGSGGQAVFTVPTRALANDKWREWRKMGWDVGIATGDVAENLSAPVLVATLETQRERLLVGDAPGLLAIDEYQMIGDKSRGLSYELAVALAPPGTQLLLTSGSVENPGEVVAWLRRLGREAELVQTLERPVPLDEMPVEELPRLPEKTGAFWTRVVASACLMDLAPVLLFAPRREAAENLARKIAAALPDDDPVELTQAQAARAGKLLVKLLRSRVAFHHSGLDYETRASVIEPLAKAGQLRAVVATTGLAAGINFSVRSVAVTETSYREGAFHRELRADEILQMFGRAGRRGLDEAGYVITARHTPRLFDAAPAKLRRVNQIDWPTLLRVMAAASAAGRRPFDAAMETCGRLFSSQTLRLGVEEQASGCGAPAGAGVLEGPRRSEFQNEAGEWQEWIEGERPLAECLVIDPGSGEWAPALGRREFVAGLGRGRPCQLDEGRFGLEVKVGRLRKPDAGGRRTVGALRWVKESVGQALSPMSREEFEQLVVPEIEFEVGRFRRLVRRGAMLAAQLDLAEEVVACVGDGLIDPPKRSVQVEVDTHYDTGGRAFDPPSGSAAHAWRKLGLVDPSGKPTRRGEVVSRFQGGEGLLVAAALEDETYPPDELAVHLANARAGYRFRDTEGGGSSRLAAAARAAFGLVDHEGYLELGLPPGYGDGAAEAIEEGSSQGSDGVGAGDLERARVEWLSLLRHVVSVEAVAWARWEGLVKACQRRLGKQASRAGASGAEVPDAVTGGRRPRKLRRSDFPR